MDEVQIYIRQRFKGIYYGASYCIPPTKSSGSVQERNGTENMGTMNRLYVHVRMYFVYAIKLMCWFSFVATYLFGIFVCTDYRSKKIINFPRF